MSTIKDRNGVYLTEAEEIKKRWQEYTELLKKSLNDPDNYSGVVTHQELDILEYEFKWDLEHITTNEASGLDGIPAEVFQMLKNDAVKVLYSICQQIWITQQWAQEVNFHSNPKQGQCQTMFKLSHNCSHFTH